MSCRTGPSSRPQAPARTFFKEFVVRLPGPVSAINRRLRERHGIVGGYDLGKDYPELTEEDIRACLAFAADRERRLLSAA